MEVHAGSKSWRKSWVSLKSLRPRWPGGCDGCIMRGPWALRSCCSIVKCWQVFHSSWPEWQPLNHTWAVWGLTQARKHPPAGSHGRAAQLWHTRARLNGSELGPRAPKWFLDCFVAKTHVLFLICSKAASCGDEFRKSLTNGHFVSGVPGLQRDGFRYANSDRIFQASNQFNSFPESWCGSTV